jgi:hypothetical protein
LRLFGFKLLRASIDHARDQAGSRLHRPSSPPHITGLLRHIVAHRNNDLIQESDLAFSPA